MARASAGDTGVKTIMLSPSAPSTAKELVSSDSDPATGCWRRFNPTEWLRTSFSAQSRLLPFMEQGNIVEEGPPSVVFTAPRSPRTRQFLHSILNRNGGGEAPP